MGRNEEGRERKCHMILISKSYQIMTMILFHFLFISSPWQDDTLGGKRESCQESTTYSMHNEYVYKYQHRFLSSVRSARLICNETETDWTKCSTHFLHSSDVWFFVKMSDVKIVCIFLLNCHLIFVKYL